MPSDADPKKLREQADALDRIIREAQEIKADVEAKLREIREAGRPERRKIVRKGR